MWLGVLPDRTGEPAVAARVAQLNSRLATLTTLVPTHRAPLLDARGRLDLAHSTDELHLSARGYAAVAEWLRDALPALRVPR